MACLGLGQTWSFGRGVSSLTGGGAWAELVIATSNSRPPIHLWGRGDPKGSLGVEGSRVKNLVSTAPAAATPLTIIIASPGRRDTWGGIQIEVMTMTMSNDQMARMSHEVEYEGRDTWTMMIAYGKDGGG